MCCGAKLRVDQPNVEELQRHTEDDFDVLQVHKLWTNAEKDQLIEAMIGKVPVDFKVDTGSQVNLLSLSLFCRACIGQ